MSKPYDEKAHTSVVFTQPPPFSMDITSPPVWQGPPGQLIPFNPATTSPDGRFGIFGTDSQVLQVTLLPGEQIQAQPGALNYKADSFLMNTTGEGCCRRCMGGESLFQVKWTNKGSSAADISIIPSYPAKIIPIDLSKSGPVNLYPGSYLAHLGQVEITFKLVRNLGAACCGGSGFFMLMVRGSGIVFINGGGTVMEKVLAPREVLHVDTESLVGFNLFNLLVQSFGPKYNLACSISA